MSLHHRGPTSFHPKFDCQMTPTPLATQGWLPSPLSKPNEPRSLTTAKAREVSNKVAGRGCSLPWLICGRATFYLTLTTPPKKVTIPRVDNVPPPSNIFHLILRRPQAKSIRPSLNVYLLLSCHVTLLSAWWASPAQVSHHHTTSIWRLCDDRRC